MKLRVGLVGLGSNWEVRHRAALRSLSDRYEVRAIFDQWRCGPNKRRANSTPTRSTAFARWRRRDDIDAVLMLSPQWYGCLPILAACDAGKAIYCAFSMELDLSKARQVKERVEQRAWPLWPSFRAGRVPPRCG